MCMNWPDNVETNLEAEVLFWLMRWASHFHSSEQPTSLSPESSSYILDIG